MTTLEIKNNNEKILIVDDESNICQILETRLSIRGYKVIIATDGEQALNLFKQEKPDLVILDVMIPRIDGYGVCTILRKESKVPIIMLTALGDISDRVTGLELGADDYYIGNLKIDTNKRQVFKDEKRVKLTGIEFNLLELLVKKAGKRLSRAYILNDVWGYTPERYVDTRVVDVHISRLRSKLEEDPSNPDLILTARGTGYMFSQLHTFNNL